MEQIKWNNELKLKELTGVTPNLTKQEWSILNDNIEYKEARRKAASVLRYLKKHIMLNDGSWSKSFDNIYNMYKRGHQYISTGQLKNIVNRLKDLGLIVIEKVKKRNVYTMPLANKLADKKVDESVDNTNLKDNSENQGYTILNNTILYTNKETEIDIIRILKNVYKGINPSLVASKKQLKDIVQATLVARGLNSNTPFHKSIQFLVFKKIKHSNQKINLLGAVNYISKVIDDRIEAYKNKLVEVPCYITGENNSLDFNSYSNQRIYDDSFYSGLEEGLNVSNVSVIS